MKLPTALLISVLLQFVYCSARAQLARVGKVLDGDTFWVGDSFKVRLIGVGAPELSDIFGLDAQRFLVGLVENKTVELIPDNQSADKDVYGRLLRYAKLGSIDINREMISQGYATAFLKYRFDRKDDYRAAQHDAMRNGRGMWAGNIQAEQKNSDSDSHPMVASPKVYLLASLALLLIVLAIFYSIKK